MNVLLGKWITWVILKRKKMIVSSSKLTWSSAIQLWLHTFWECNFTYKKFRRSGVVIDACRRSGFDPCSGQTHVFETGSDSSTAKRSATGVSVTGPRRWQLYRVGPCQSRCGTFKIPHCSMAMKAEYRSKFVGFNGNGDISKWPKNSQAGRKPPKNKENKNEKLPRKLMKTWKIINIRDLEDP